MVLAVLIIAIAILSSTASCGADYSSSVQRDAMSQAIQSEVPETDGGRHPVPSCAELLSMKANLLTINFHERGLLEDQLREYDRLSGICTHQIHGACQFGHRQPGKRETLVAKLSLHLAADDPLVTVVNDAMASSCLMI
jgi:hypothetical protein